MSDISAATVEITFVGNDGPVRQTYANVLRDLRNQNVAVGSGGGGGPSYSRGGPPVAPVNSMLSDRYDTRYENRLASDRVRGQRDNDRQSQEAERKQVQYENRLASDRSREERIRQRKLDAEGRAAEAEERRLNKSIEQVADEERRFASRRERGAFGGGPRGGGGEEESGGGGAFGGKFFSRFGRLAGGYYLATELERVMSGQMDYQQQNTMAGNDQSRILQLMMKRREELFGVPIVGFLARLASDPTGASAAAIQSQADAAGLADNVSASRLSVQDYRRDSATRAGVFGAYSSDRKSAEAQSLFQKSVNERRALGKQTSDAALAERDKSITAANATYDAWVSEQDRKSLWGLLPSLGNGINALDDFNQKKKRDDAVHAARDAFTKTDKGREPSAKEMEDMAAPVRAALREQRLEQQQGMSLGLRNVALASAEQGRSNAIVAADGFVSYDTQKKYMRATHEAEEAAALRNGGIVGMQAVWQSNKAIEKAADAIHEREVFLADHKINGEIRALDLNLSYRPLESRIEGLRNDADLEKLKTDDPDTLDAIDTRYGRQRQLAVREFWQQEQETDTTLDAQRNALKSALSRGPAEEGEAYNIGASGLNASRRLLRLFGKAEGEESRDNALLQLDLLRQNYFDSFHGAQVDQRLIATQGGRQTEEPDKVVAAIEQAKQELIEGFAAALKEVVDAGG